MDIACPNCAATYRVPDSLLARGIALRCASCDHAWLPEVPQPLQEAQAAPETATVVQSPAPPAPAPELPPEPRAEPVAEPLAEPRPEPRSEPPTPAPPEMPRAIPVRAPPPTTPPPLQRRHQAVPRPGEGRAPAPRRINAALALAWLASITVVALTVFALFAWGEEIAMAWPPFERVQSMLRG